MNTASPTPLLPVDHVIFYAGFELPALAGFFERIGFTPTPLGRHATGSVNRLVILQDTYLELIGFDPGTPPTVRPELHACQPSLNGIAFRGEPSPQWAADRLARFNPVFDLKRPVESGALSGIARFRITTLREVPRDFRLFLCNHLTPEFVWHPPWMRHANGASAVKSVRATTQEPAAFRAALGTVGSASGEPVQGSALSEDGVRIELAPPGAPSLVTLASRDLAATAQCLSAARVPFERGEDGGLCVTVPGLQSARLEFVQGGAA